jgi:hypothetical protein
MPRAGLKAAPQAVWPQPFERAEDPDAPLCTDTGRSDSPEIRQILMGLGPLNTQFDLPAAISTLERLLGLDGRGRV